jgi:glutathione synthase/RimK-type ligase-like ATP-grasp enzyme
MIVLCGIPSEPPLRAVIDAAERAGAAHAVLNQREAHQADLALHGQHRRVDGVLRIRGTEIPLGSIRGVYLRLTDQHVIPENRRRQGRWSNPSLEAARSSVLHTALVDWLETAPCRVLNPVGRMASNMSKPYQAQRILRAGFDVPATLVTSDPSAVRAFARRYERIVFKSASSVRSIVQELRADKMQDLERIRLLPTQFQQYVAGTNIRVHVVGERVFATEIRTDAIDYRYAARDSADVTLRACELGSAVAGRCVALSRALGLPLVGIDLIRTQQGEYFCLEANPSPAYTFYQEHTGQPIAEAIVQHLAEGA